MNITQIPAAASQWGLSSLIPGVSGRLFQKIDTIVIHWMDGTLASTDRVFMGKSIPVRPVSSHFGIEDGEVHQYVKLQDTAWHAGNWLVNLRSVGIEHSAQPGRDATDATYETSSQLIVEICRQLGLTPSRDLLKRHSDIVPTQCPGTIDIDRIARRSVEIWNGKLADGSQPITITTASTQVSTAVTRSFAPFITNLEPSQVYNEEVKRMQEFLVMHKCMQDQGQNDGYYGPITQHAVNAFQLSNHITSKPEYFGWWYEKTRTAANNQLTITTQS